MRAGANAVDHAITTFTHVRLPPNALLGDLGDVPDKRAHFFECIERIGVGTLAVSFSAVPALLVSCYVAAAYSKRRFITSAGRKIPVIAIRTQLLPILRGLAFLFHSKMGGSWMTSWWNKLQIIWRYGVSSPSRTETL